MTPKQTRRVDGNIEFTFWLVFGVDGTVRSTRKQGILRRDERAMQVVTTLPKSLFQTASLKATIVVPDEGSPAFEIDVKSAQSALRGALGVDVDMLVLEQTAPKPEPET